ncbi:MAG: hypothetical protein ABIO04_09360 [Ferruginibacter sp.]
MFVKWQRDKWKHFFVGIILGSVLYLISIYLVNAQPYLAGLVSVLTLVMICYGFELFSKFTGKGHYEMMDAIAGVLGGLIGIGALWLVL